MIRLLVLLPVMAAASSTPKVVPNYGNVALPFEPNQGQASADVHYVSSAGAYTLSIHKDGATIAAPGSEVRMRLLDALQPRTMQAFDKLPGVSNYLTGSDSLKWLRNIPQYRRVKLQSVYKGIDLVYYGTGSTVEYDFVIAPRVDPGVVSFRFEGSDEVRLSPEGDLILKMGDGELRQHRPLAYQMAGGKRRAVEARFALVDGTVRFVVGRYDHSKELVIDPSIVYSYFDADGTTGKAIALDPTGAAYLLLPRSFSSPNATILKVNAEGTAIVYRTAVRGAVFNAIAVDTTGAVYMTGTADPFSGFVVKNPLQSVVRGPWDSIVAKLNTAGNDFVYATYLGGSGQDTATRIAVDSTGAVYVAGATTSPDFPTKNPTQTLNRGGTDAFLTKINPQGSDLVFSTYYGGNAAEAITGLAIDSAGNMIIAGTTSSTDLAFTRRLFDQGNGYIVRYTPAGIVDVATLVPVTISSSVAVDSGNNLVFGGYPNTAFLPGQRPGAVIARINAAMNQFRVVVDLPSPTSGDIFGVAIGPGDTIYATGGSNSIPLVRSIQPLRGGRSPFLLKAANDGGIIYSTVIGFGTGNDLAVDASGGAYMIGLGNFVEFPGIHEVGPTPFATSGGFAMKIVDNPDLRLVRVQIAVDVGASLIGGVTGLILTADGIPFNDYTIFYWNAGETHTVSITNPFYSRNGVRYSFTGWSDGGETTHTVTPTADVNLTAKFFTEIQVVSRAEVEGTGTVSISPASPKGDGFYPLGTRITATAVPASGRFLYQWNGVLRTANNPQSFTVIYGSAGTAGANLVIGDFRSTPPPPQNFSLGFVPVTPCRLVDTRAGSPKIGNFGPGPLAGGAVRTFPVLDGGCGIPSGAKAYSLHATVYPKRPMAFLTLYSAGQSLPFVSTLNAFEGQSVSNMAVVGAGDSGAISAYASDDTDLTLDVYGYFIDTDDSLSFNKLFTPCLIQIPNGPMAANTTRTINPRNSGCSIPSNATAYMMNVTAVPTGPSEGITVWPTGATRPSTTILSSPFGRNLVNNVIVGSGADGSINIYSGQTVNVTVQVLGYFAPATANSFASRYFVATPCRMADTRGPGGQILGPGNSQSFGLGSCNVRFTPLDNLLVNITALPVHFLGFDGLLSAQGLGPVLLTPNEQIVSNTVPVGSFFFMDASVPMNVVVDLQGYFAR